MRIINMVKWKDFPVFCFFFFEGKNKENQGDRNTGMGLFAETHSPIHQLHLEDLVDTPLDFFFFKTKSC